MGYLFLNMMTQHNQQFQPYPDPPSCGAREGSGNETKCDLCEPGGKERGPRNNSGVTVSYFALSQNHLLPVVLLRALMYTQRY